VLEQYQPLATGRPSLSPLGFTVETKILGKTAFLAVFFALADPASAASRAAAEIPAYLSDRRRDPRSLGTSPYRA